MKRIIIKLLEIIIKKLYIILIKRYKYNDKLRFINNFENNDIFLYYN